MRSASLVPASSDRAGRATVGVRRLAAPLATALLVSLLGGCSEPQDPAGTPGPSPVDTGHDAEGDAFDPDGTPSNDTSSDTTEGPDASGDVPPDAPGPGPDATPEVGPDDVLEDPSVDPIDDVVPDAAPETGPDATEDVTSDTTLPDTTEPDVGDPDPLTPSPFTVTDGTRDDGILLEWGAVPGALGYRILRDGDTLETVSGGTLSWLDATARDADLPTAPANVRASTDRGDGILVQWDAQTPRQAPVHEYRVLALFDDSDGEPSVRRIGRRAPATLTWELRRGTGAWTSVGTGTSFLDADATGGAFTLGLPVPGRGTSPDGVPLNVESVTFEPGPNRDYSVRAVSRVGAGPASATVIGRRTYREADLTWQWTRFSTQSGNNPSNPTALRSRAVLDTGAPSNGNAVYYRLTASAPDGTQRQTGIAMGFRAWNCVDNASFEGGAGASQTVAAVTGRAGLLQVEQRPVPGVFANNDRITLNPPLQVTGAIVTAADRFPRENFWVEDADTALRVRLATPLENNVLPGQRVSFRVREIYNFGGHINISDISDFTVVGTGPVSITQRSGDTISLTSYNRIVRVAGEITASLGNCGGSSICYELQHGPANSPVISRFRTTSNRVVVGRCLTFVGPNSSFPGPFQATPARSAEVDGMDWDWFQVIE